MAATVDKKLRNLYYEKLYKMRRDTPGLLKSKISDDHLRELTMSLLDGTVFEIVKELDEIQQLNERSLLNKRMKVVSQQKSKRATLLRSHKEEVLVTEHQNMHLVQSRHDAEQAELGHQLSEQLKVLDQEIILELDQLLSEQQSTLHQAAVPFFRITNNPQDIQIQICILSYIQRLYQECYQ